MPNDPTHWFAVAGEDSGHFEAVTRLTDRVLEARVEWFTGESRDRLRGWRGPDAASTWSKLKDAFGKARATKLPIHGHFQGAQALDEAVMVRAQLFLWQWAHLRGEPISVGFIARDTDHKDRRAGAEQAIAAGQWSFKVVLAYPVPEIEAWYLVGFDPANDAERARLAKLSADLGFSPVSEPERLTSTVNAAAKDAKQVLSKLVNHDLERRNACLEAALDVPESRSVACGLADFLRAVEREIVPLFCGRSPDGDG